MPLQNPNILSMVGLGSLHDSPPTSLQPKLIDAVHLRWAFRPDLGFPWHGFYLFRREHTREAGVCLRPKLRPMPPGPFNSAVWASGIGHVRSDQPLHFTETFPDPGVAEIDLGGRSFVEFLPLDVAFLITLEIGFQSTAKIQLSAFAGQATVAQTTVEGQAGAVVSVQLRADAIDRLRISSGDAALIDLCTTSAIRDARAGWKPLDGPAQPIALPVRHPDYPCSSLPTDLGASRGDALARITYGDPTLWTTPFDELHEQCLNLVRGGPAVPMNSPDRAITFPVTLEPGDTSAPPASPRQQPLHLVLLSSMHAPHAQMLGLYWSDKTAVPGEIYDYLIVADRIGAAGHGANKILGLIDSSGFTQLDAFIVFGKQVQPAVPLAPPQDVRSYALSGATRPDPSGELIDASCNAGLRWNLPIVGNVLMPESAVLYHVWRADYGAAQPAAEAGIDKFQPLTSDAPLLIVENLLSMSGVQRPQDWPPFPLFAFDNALAEGWYGYRVSGVDIFGRHSALGAAAQWYEWTPVPNPRPWYYVDPPSDQPVHPFAIGLLDKMPPPPPTGVEATALDPADPFLLRDGVYVSWFATLSAAEQAAVTGLRVRWKWTHGHLRQAPDTREFRIYYRNGRSNAIGGRTIAVNAASPTESFVQTDITHTNAAGAFAGCSFKVGPHLFSILDSDAASPLRLRVKNVGPLKDVAPRALANCDITIPAGHALFVDYGPAHAWEERCYVVGFDEHVTVSVDDSGRPLRLYEVLLPASDDAFRGGLPLVPDLTNPTAFGAVAVTAADSRAHTADHAKWSTGRFGGRTGNESTTSAPAIVFRVLRDRPAPPVPPPDSDRVFATPADYHAASYYTFRWAPQPFLKTHVSRAMDDAIFNVDWSLQPRAPIDPDGPAIFPDESVDPTWNHARRLGVAQELDVLNTFARTPAGRDEARAYYRRLSNDGLRVLASLPGNEAAFTQQTVQPIDPDDPAAANRVGPDNPPDFAVDPALRVFVDTLDGRSTNRFFYRASYVDGAQNRSALGPSGPPIWLPNVVAPKPPSFTKVLAGGADPAQPGDNKITLRWASNREADLAEYRVYRTMDRANARSIRSMTLVHTAPVPAGDPALRPAENVWTDADLPALQWIYYRMTAVDSAGNESAPNDPVTARAFDESLPAAPPLTVAWEATPVNLATASWTAATETRLERRGATELIWENVSDWLAPGSHAVDNSIDEHFPWKFRLRARKPTGALTVGPEVNLFRK